MTPGDANGEGGAQRAVALVAASNGALFVPPDTQLRWMREQAKHDGTLKDLHQVLAALEAVAAKCNVAHEEFVRLAEARLEVERDLGAQLAQTVRQGRPRKSVTRGDLSASTRLPEGISKQQARKYRALAAIGEEVFHAYLASMREKGRVPSAAGARRFAASPEPASKRPVRKRTDHFELPVAVLDAISRIMTPDVCVGEAALSVRRRVKPSDKDVLDQLRGDVFIADCPQPATWLPALRRLRNKGRVQQVVVALPAEMWAEWIRELQEGEWATCFLSGARDRHGLGRVLAHQGARVSAFRVALAHVGTCL